MFLDFRGQQVFLPTVLHSSRPPDMANRFHPDGNRPKIRDQLGGPDTRNASMSGHQPDVRNGWKAGLHWGYNHPMTDEEADRLRDQIFGGERPVEQFRALLNLGVQKGLEKEQAETLSDLWQLTFTRKGLFPPLEAAKAIVEITAASDDTYALLTNDGTIYDSLLPAERRELAQHIRNCIVEFRPSRSTRALEIFVSELFGDGP